MEGEVEDNRYECSHSRRQLINEPCNKEGKYIRGRSRCDRKYQRVLKRSYKQVVIEKHA